MCTAARGRQDDRGGGRRAPGRPCREQRVAVAGLDDAQRAEPVEPLGELPGEDRRHVLDDAGPARRGAAERGSTLASASGPPVEEPITRRGPGADGSGARAPAGRGASRAGAAAVARAARCTGRRR